MLGIGRTEPSATWKSNWKQQRFTIETTYSEQLDANTDTRSLSEKTLQTLIGICCETES